MEEEPQTAETFKEIQIINQLDPIITSICPKYNLKCKSSMCGFLSCAISLYISKYYTNALAKQNPKTPQEIIDNIINIELSNPSNIISTLEKVLSYIENRRKGYIDENYEEFGGGEEENYRNTVMGGQEIREWLMLDEVADLNIPTIHFMRNIATGPKNKIDIRFEITDYKRHKDEWEYIQEELKFHGEDFYFQNNRGELMNIQDWCSRYWNILSPISTPYALNPIITDFWGHYAVIIPLLIEKTDPLHILPQNYYRPKLLLLNTLPGWEMGNWPHITTLLNTFK